MTLPGVGPWKVVGRAPLFNGERLRSIASVKLFKSVHRHS